MLGTDTFDVAPDHLRNWLTVARLDGVLNHEVREHMASDLVRYVFASAFALVNGSFPQTVERVSGCAPPAAQELGERQVRRPLRGADFRLPEFDDHQPPFEGRSLLHPSGPGPVAQPLREGGCTSEDGP